MRGGGPQISLTWLLFVHFSRTENHFPLQSDSYLQRGQDSDRDSLDEYEEGLQFNEDGSFLGEYGDEKEWVPEEKYPSKSPMDTAV